MKIVLASGSERRRALLSWLDIPFEVFVSRFEESSIEESDPRKLVSRLALEKAKAVAKDLNDGLVVGADTIVYIDDEIIGKPKDGDDAMRILRKLSGNTHQVFTGIAVVNVRSGNRLVEIEKTAVTFRKLSNEEINDYVSTGEPLDKGGGYAIQMGAAGFVEKVEGSYTNVVGLPLLTLQKLLKKSGFPIVKDFSQIALEKTGYPS